MPETVLSSTLLPLPPGPRYEDQSVFPSASGEAVAKPALQKFDQVIIAVGRVSKERLPEPATGGLAWRNRGLAGNPIARPRRIGLARPKIDCHAGTA